jgi:nucleotide-binding universal stress UspA family protein
MPQAQMHIESPDNAGSDVTIFRRVLVGVDGSPAGREAARQGATLADPDGTLKLLAAWILPAPTAVDAYSPYPIEEPYRHAAEEALRHAVDAAAPRDATTALESGSARDALLDAAAAEGSTLVVVGSHGQSRVRGILLGSTATELVHRAPCSVLVARRAGADFPSHITVGLDGSRRSAAAYAVARSLGDRFGAEVWPVAAHGGKSVDKRLLAAIVDEWEDLQDDPVIALTAAAADGDLLVVGSRGLHGWKALGSVSEQVAHAAHCSVLVVRTEDRP